PMAGSEKSGIGNAREDLFEGTTCILTPTLFTTETALQRVRWLWTIAGCRLLEMSPEEHDRKVACISHMPHLAAAAIALSALRDDRDAARCAGNGFRDTTRIASGDPQLWTGIISQNRTQTLAAMSGLQDGLTRLIQVIEQGDDNALLDLLKEAKAVRDQALNS
ncbi:MAG: prephenate dehydrogenase/arogenate dehydrogenase family protein, partial [Verrucomicrobiaceae bacterium]